jgi:hypothetical protein
MNIEVKGHGYFDFLLSRNEIKIITIYLQNIENAPCMIYLL